MTKRTIQDNIYFEGYENTFYVYSSGSIHERLFWIRIRELAFDSASNYIHLYTVTVIVYIQCDALNIFLCYTMYCQIVSQFPIHTLIRVYQKKIIHIIYILICSIYGDKNFASKSFTPTARSFSSS